MNASPEEGRLFLMDTVPLCRKSHSPAALLAWLQLLRAPNLLTVPGDPLVGFLLAHSPGSGLIPAAYAAGSAVLLYMSGLIWNDLADLKEDSRTRPSRPLPSGRVGPRSAATVAAILGIAAVALSFLAGPMTGLAAVVLLALVLAYDFLTKHLPVPGSLNMGLCRGMSVMLGAFAAGSGQAVWQRAIPAAAGMTLYTAAVAIVANRETQKVNLDRLRWLPLGAIIICFSAYWLLGYFTGASVVAAGIAVAWIWYWTARLRGRPEPRIVVMTIGSLIGAMLLLQAFFCALTPAPGVIAALCLLAALPLNLLLAKCFHGS
jgi:4-hydroxybenzoate polyprenyltransferase